MDHILTQTKHPYTELEFVVLPCLEITAGILHRGKKLLIK